MSVSLVALDPEFKHPALYRPGVGIGIVRWFERLLRRFEDGVGVMPRIGRGPCPGPTSHELYDGEHFPIAVLSTQYWFVVDVDVPVSVAVAIGNARPECPWLDAYVVTDAGVHLVYRVASMGKVRQAGDPRYSTWGARRGLWPMRLTFKRERTQARHMVGISAAGQELARAWNACANYVAGLSQDEINLLPEVR